MLPASAVNAAGAATSFLLNGDSRGMKNVVTLTTSDAPRAESGEGITARRPSSMVSSHPSP
jgi:hypothetical protein